MSYATTALSPVEQAKVPTPGYLPLTWDELVRAVNARIYGYLEPASGEPWGQIVTISSPYDLERFEGRLSFAWTSDATVVDLIGRA